MRYHDAERAVVECSGGLVQRPGANAHDRRHTAWQRRDTDLRYLLDRDRTVLGIEEKPVVAGGLGQHGYRGTTQMMHAEAEHELAGAELLEGIVAQQSHDVPPRVRIAPILRLCPPCHGRQAPGISRPALSSTLRIFDLG